MEANSSPISKGLQDWYAKNTHPENTITTPPTPITPCQEEETAEIDKLPFEMIALIFSSFSLEEISRLKSVCHAWKLVAEKNTLDHTMIRNFEKIALPSQSDYRQSFYISKDNYYTFKYDNGTSTAHFQIVSPGKTIDIQHQCGKIRLKDLEVLSTSVLPNGYIGIAVKERAKATKFFFLLDPNKQNVSEWILKKSIRHANPAVVEAFDTENNFLLVSLDGVFYMIDQQDQSMTLDRITENTFQNKTGVSINIKGKNLEYTFMNFSQEGFSITYTVKQSRPPGYAIQQIFPYLRGDTAEILLLNSCASKIFAEAKWFPIAFAVNDLAPKLSGGMITMIDLEKKIEFLKIKFSNKEILQKIQWISKHSLLHLIFQGKRRVYFIHRNTQPPRAYKYYEQEGLFMRQEFLSPEKLRFSYQGTDQAAIGFAKGDLFQFPQNPELSCPMPMDIE